MFMTNNENDIGVRLENIRSRHAQKRRKRKIRRVIAAVTSLAVCMTIAGIVYSSYLKEINITEIDEFSGT